LAVVDGCAELLCTLPIVDVGGDGSSGARTIDPASERGGSVPRTRNLELYPSHWPVLMSFTSVFEALNLLFTALSLTMRE
jgi:hypothetical protein